MVGPDLLLRIEVVEYGAVAHDHTQFGDLGQVTLGVQVQVAIGSEADIRTRLVPDSDRAVGSREDLNVLEHPDENAQGVDTGS